MIGHSLSFCKVKLFNQGYEINNLTKNLRVQVGMCPPYIVNCVHLTPRPSPLAFLNLYPVIYKWSLRIVFSSVRMPHDLGISSNHLIGLFSSQIIQAATVFGWLYCKPVSMAGIQSASQRASFYWLAPLTIQKKLAREKEICLSLDA